MLILLPPSEGKATPTRGKPLTLGDLDFPELTDARAEVLAALVELCSGDVERAAGVLGIGSTQTDLVQLNAGLTTAATARADRIDLLKDGTLAVLDYKTGQPPSAKQVRSGLSPQLTLQAAMLRHGSFSGLTLPKPLSVSHLIYLRLSGGDPGGKQEDRDFGDESVDDISDRTYAELRKLVQAFASPDQPYKSFARPMFFGRTYGDYDHLARVREWSASGEGDGE